VQKGCAKTAWKGKLFMMVHCKPSQESGFILALGAVETPQPVWLEKKGKGSIQEDQRILDVTSYSTGS
jgi:hypothetical protein